MLNQKAHYGTGLKIFMLSVLVMLISACSSGLDGTYTDGSGMVEYQFNTDGKVAMTTLGIETVLDYEIDGDKLKIHSSGNTNLVFTINEDGTLAGPMGMDLHKKKN